MIMMRFVWSSFMKARASEYCQFKHVMPCLYKAVMVACRVIVTCNVRAPLVDGMSCLSASQEPPHSVARSHATLGPVVRAVL